MNLPQNRKATFARLLLLLVVVLVLGFGAYSTYDWWQLRQKRRELFIYFQSKSRITHKIPPDATIFIDLFDFKRVYGSLQKTEFCKVLTHWLDTGMSDKQKPNPLLGNMLEKTILNVIGKEVGVGVLPSKTSFPDVFAVSELAPGSDFLLNLALSNARHVRKIEEADRMIYAVQTKMPEYPEVFVTVDEEFAYACTSLARLNQTFQSVGAGPTFLSQIPVEPIPEDTFFFLQSRSSKLSVVAYGSGGTYHMQSRSDVTPLTPIPALGKMDNSILRVQTNGPELFLQPSASYVLQSLNGQPLSTLVLGFQDANKARQYDDFLLRQLSEDASGADASAGVEAFKTENADCHQSPEKGIVCLSQNVLLLTNGGLLRTPPPAPITGQTPLPLTVYVELTPEPIRGFLDRVNKQDWSLFPQMRPFYFLSCIKSVTGSIDRTHDELSVELN